MSAGREVAIVVMWRERVGLFRDPRKSGTDAGAWRCLLGDLHDGEDVLAGAARTLCDTTGLVVRDLAMLAPGPVLRLRDDAGAVRTVATVLARSNRRRLRTDQTLLLHRWARRNQIARFDGQVAWLREVVDAVLPDDIAGSVIRSDRRPVSA